MPKIKQSDFVRGRPGELSIQRVGKFKLLPNADDPREAPRVWKVMSIKRGDQPTNFFWSNHDNNATRRTYLMAELKNNYSGIDFDGYKRSSDRFAGMWSALNPPPAPKKVKVKY